MQHEEHSQPAAPGFGTNTNGLGIFIVAAVAVCLALFCWNFWKDASREAELYRWDTSAKAGHGESHEAGAEHGEGAEHNAAEPAAVHATDTTKTETADSAGAEAHDTTKPAAADTSKAHH